MRPRILYIGIVFFTAAVLGYAAEVPTFHGDNYRTGRTETIGAAAPKLLWKFQAEASFAASPILNKDGTIYAASTDYNLYALNPDGKIKWVYSAGDALFSTPAIGPDGMIYMADAVGNYYAIKPDGNPLWEKKITGGADCRILSPILAAPSGQIYFGAWTDLFYSVNSDGGVRWQAKMSGLVSAAGALDSEGNIYVAAFDVRRSSNLAVYKYRPTSNTAIWTYSDGLNVSCNRIDSSPVIDVERGQLYIGACRKTDGVLYAIDLSGGTRKFKVALPKGILATPALAKDGTIYVGCLDGKLYALNPTDGSTKWTFTSDGYCIMGSPTVDGNGSIYFGDSDGIFYALSSEGKELWRFTANSNIASAPAISDQGTIYFTSYDSTIYALGTPTAIVDWSEY